MDFAYARPSAFVTVLLALWSSCLCIVTFLLVLVLLLSFFVLI